MSRTRTKPIMTMLILLPLVIGCGEDKKESAETYQREKYPEVLKALSKVVEGTPKVETFEVANSTSHKIAASTV